MGKTFKNIEKEDFKSKRKISSLKKQNMLNKKKTKRQEEY